MENQNIKKVTPREVLLECRGVIADLRHVNRVLQEDNVKLRRQIDMMLDLHDRGSRGGLHECPDPLFDKIQGAIAELYDDGNKT